MTSLKEFNRAVDTFKASFKAGRWESSKNELSKLKIMMTQLPSLSPIGEQTATSIEENLLAREVLEYAVLLSVRLEDEESFERNFLQLETYYFDRSSLATSENESLMLGLHLMLLLVQKRTAEFHMGLERIPPHLHDTDRYVKYAIELEQRLMEGSYSKVLTSRNDLPAPEYYTYFINQLETTVREEIASCCEKAYGKLKVKDAAKLMMVESVDEMLQYAENKMKTSNEDRENGAIIGKDSTTDIDMTGEASNNNAWGIHDGEIHFKPELHQSTTELSSLDIIKRTLMYARELERIV